MSAKVPCPDKQSLQQLLLGRIPAPDGDALYQHLETCQQCERYAETFRADDRLLAAVRASGGDATEHPSLNQLMAALRRSGPPDARRWTPTAIFSPPGCPTRCRRSMESPTRGANCMTSWPPRRRPANWAG